MAMIREFGPPTLFLTFSCAEYDSVDIERHLRKVNEVPDSYPIARLFTDDPISVSRKFAQKLRNFLLKSSGTFYNGAAARNGTWRSYTLFLKKEYQSRGAPHSASKMQQLWE